MTTPTSSKVQHPKNVLSTIHLLNSGIHSADLVLTFTVNRVALHALAVPQKLNHTRQYDQFHVQLPNMHKSTSHQRMTRLSVVNGSLRSTLGINMHIQKQKFVLDRHPPPSHCLLDPLVSIHVQGCSLPTPFHMICLRPDIKTVDISTKWMDSKSQHLVQES